MTETELRLDVGGSIPREEWSERYRRVVEYFETVEDLREFESGGHNPLDDSPYVLHADYRAPLRPDGDSEYSWSILLNPWSSPGMREAFVTDGSPLLPKNTAHGAGPDDHVASEEDLVDVHAGRLVVCVALTKVAGIHSRGETWIHCDPEIEAQFDSVLDDLEAAAEGGAVSDA